MGLILICLFLFRYAEPVKDGDVFFHMKYGEYHLQHHTLLADHSIFSWTPAAKYVPYCTWASDILFYSLYKAGGWPLLFAFKYLCLFIPIFLVWLFARRRIGAGNHFFTFFVLVIVLFSIVDAAFLKPELISLVFFALVTALYFHLKIHCSEPGKGLFFLFYPLLFLFWSNMHGVFIFGLVLLASIISGETINFFVNSKYAFSKRGMLALLVSGPLSVFATLLTPYGTDLMLLLFNTAKSGLASNVVKNVRGYQTLFDTIDINQVQHNLEYWGVMVVLFAVIFFANYRKNRDWDFGIFLPTVALAFLNVKFARSTYYWPTFWAMSIFYLSDRDRLHLSDEISNAKPLTKYSLAVLISCLLIYFPVRGVYEAYFRPARWMYSGFGFSYSQPVQESAFLKAHKIGTRLYNSYNTGSYLLFDLYPERKVFIDPRYFPYKDTIFDQFMDFREGRVSLEEMEAQYGFDIALIAHTEKLASVFLESRQWRPVFYGTVGIVFVRSDLDYHNDILKIDHHRFDSLKNVIQAADITRTAQNLNDLETSAYVLGVMEKRMHHMTGYKYWHQYGSFCQKGLEAYESGHLDQALRFLWPIGFNDSNMKINRVLRDLIAKKADTLVQKRKYNDALQLVTRVLQHYPNDADSLYDAGVIAYLASREAQNANNKELIHLWRQLLGKLISIAPEYPHADVATKILTNENVAGTLPLALSASERS